MRKKIFYVLECLLCVIIMVALTGCENNEIKEENNNDVIQEVKEKSKEEFNEANIQEAKEELKGVNTQQEQLYEKNLTVENFKKIMQKYGFKVTTYGEDDPNTVNVTYQAVDKENETYYELEVWKDEEGAINCWNNVVKKRYSNKNPKILRDEEKEHYARLETEIVPYGSTYTTINFREYNMILDVEIKSKAVSFARNVISELGYADSEENENSKSAEEKSVLQVGNYTLKYGTYKGTAMSGEYTLTKTIKVTKNEIITEIENLQYKIEGNEIVGANGQETFKLIITGNNTFTDAGGIYKYTYWGE